MAFGRISSIHPQIAAIGGFGNQKQCYCDRCIHDGGMVQTLENCRAEFDRTTRVMNVLYDENKKLREMLMKSPQLCDAPQRGLLPLHLPLMRFPDQADSPTLNLPPIQPCTISLARHTIPMSLVSHLCQLRSRDLPELPMPQGKRPPPPRLPMIQMMLTTSPLAQHIHNVWLEGSMTWFDGTRKTISCTYSRLCSQRFASHSMLARIACSANSW